MKPGSIQPRDGKFQLRVKHRLLPKPYFHTFDTEDQAIAFGLHLKGLLAKGTVPAELLVQERVNVTPLLIEVVRAYTLRCEMLTTSDDELLSTVIKDAEMKALRVGDITDGWVDEYVKALKKRKLAPGTIRKRIGVLGRVIDWHNRQEHANEKTRPANPFKGLPDAYSLYPNAEVIDTERDLRLAPEQWEKVEKALAGEKREDRERPWPTSDEFRLFYELIVDTGLRLSEAYKLRVDGLDTPRSLLRTDGSKGHRGKKKPRIVPLKPAMRAKLVEWSKHRKGLMFTFWDGTKVDERKCTHRLSARFATLHAYAGVPELREHDLRHEACCRWVTLKNKVGGWMFNETEICRIMGWTDSKMLLRYASLRGEDWSDRLAA